MQTDAERRGSISPGQDRLADTAGNAPVSVIIPCFNQGRFLADALNSVARQTQPPDEIIVVDDGSTDNTVDVAQRHPGVRLVRQDNRGLAAARNTGMEASSGRFLVFLDADDRLLPDAIEAGLRCLEGNAQCAFAYGRFRWIREDGSPVNHLPTVHRRSADAYQAFLEGNFIGMHATVMYRRDALVGAGGFDPALRLCEDYDTYLRIARKLPICAHEATVAEYRLHPASLSHDNGRMLEAVLAVLEAQARYTTNEDRRRSFARGRRAWRDYYGERLVGELLRAVLRGRWRDAARIGRTMRRLCGGQTPSVFMLYFVPLRLRRLPWRVVRRPVVGQR